MDITQIIIVVASNIITLLIGVLGANYFKFKQLISAINRALLDDKIDADEVKQIWSIITNTTHNR